VCCHSCHLVKPGGQIGLVPYSASHSGHLDSVLFAADNMLRIVYRTGHFPVAAWTLAAAVAACMTLA
jgi:hypothetical protein